jgi:threonine/homoserine/homoserine lactone efflux protein
MIRPPRIIGAQGVSASEEAMFDGAQLAGFVAVATVLVVVPGPNTVMILAQSLNGGRAAGLASALGVEAGTLVHTAAAALGLSAVLSTSAVAFDVVKYVGASYLAFLGLRGLVSGSRSHPGSAPAARLRPSQAFWRAMLGCVLNPKAALFFIALLPQFVRAERGHVVLQFLVLGLIVAALGLACGTLLALAAGTVSSWLRRDAVARWQQRLTGGVLLGLGVRLAFARRE